MLSSYEKRLYSISARSKRRFRAGLLAVREKVGHIDLKSFPKLKEYFSSKVLLHKRGKAVIAAVAALALIVVVATPLLFNSYREKKEIDKLKDVVTYSTDQPSEKQVQAKQYNVPPDQPRIIKIPSASIEGFIQRSGVDQNNQIAVPNNIYFAGWFIDSVKPGDKGLSIVTGHVDGNVSNGIFKELQKVKVGDRYYIIYGDGSTREFEVVDLIVADKDRAHVDLFAKREGVLSQLNLVTCTGTYIKSEKTYDKRLIVVSSRVDRSTR